MTQLFSALENEVARYKDISHILRKLQDDGEIESLFETFKHIFDNEHDFTMQELSRIEDERKQKLNLSEQCESNLFMFKSNFQLIVSMIFERAFKATVAEKTGKSARNNFESTRAETTLGNTTTNLTTIIPETPKKKSKKSKAKRVASPNRSNILDLSLDQKTPKYKGKKLSTSHLSTSQTQSPLAKIFGTNSTFANEKSFMISTGGKTPKTNQDVSPTRQSRVSDFQSTTSLNKSLFVQSEFNYITGPATFPRSPKCNTDSRTVSPGPAAYTNSPSSFRQNPVATIDKAAKTCWFDDIAARNESPGPGGRYPSHHFISK
jgi:hypothetical protein